MKNNLQETISGLNKRASAASVGRKTTEKFQPELWQVTVVYKKLCDKRNFLDKPFYINIQYVSPEVFMSRTEAEQFAPYFIKKLVDDKVIGDEVILEDKSVDMSLATIGVAKLMLTKMERQDPMEVPS